MQIYHEGEKDYKGFHPGDIKYGAISVLFSVMDFTSEYNEDMVDLIDTFFEKLSWQE